jgi:hypothetical protein
VSVEGRFVIAEPAELAPGMRIEISLAKTARLRWPSHGPRVLNFTVICRDADSWLMHVDAHRPPSRVSDTAPCYRDGRMILRGRVT